ncbi:MAG: phosphatase PAP2 family protein [Candidatus Dormibacteraceae bacterium]
MSRRWWWAWLCAALALIFLLQGLLVVIGWSEVADQRVNALVAGTWQPTIGLYCKFWALLGGIEATTLLAIGLFVYLRRQGFKREAWALLAFPLAILLESLYRHFVAQPPPPNAHGDGWSLAMLLPGHERANTFPSGHMLRTVLIYGLLAFVVARLAPASRLRQTITPLVGILVIVMAASRLYLAVHWQSDVVGGAALGGTALVAAIMWMERPG